MTRGGADWLPVTESADIKNGHIKISHGAFLVEARRIRIPEVVR